MTKNKKKKKNGGDGRWGTDRKDRFPKSYDPQEVLAWTDEHADKKDRRKRVDFDGHMMKPLSVRYQTFIQSGCDCVVCGLKGTVMYKERNYFSGNVQNTNGSYHFNLYGEDKFGDEVLLTKDHIIAKSLGGSNGVNNMQTMCSRCNLDKGAMTVEEWDKYQKTTIKPKVVPNLSKPKNSRKRKKFKQCDSHVTVENRMTAFHEHGKVVCQVTSLRNKVCLAKSLEQCQAKYSTHTVKLADDKRIIQFMLTGQ